MRKFEDRIDSGVVNNWSQYVLKCNNDKWYVGLVKTKNFDCRIRDQFGVGNYPPSKWCQQYPPLHSTSVIDLGPMTYEQAQNFEDNTTQVLQDIFGENEVMGGRLCRDEKLGSR